MTAKSAVVARTGFSHRSFQLVTKRELLQLLTRLSLVQRKYSVASKHTQVQRLWRLLAAVVGWSRSGPGRRRSPVTTPQLRRRGAAATPPNLRAAPSYCGVQRRLTVRVPPPRRTRPLTARGQTPPPDRRKSPPNCDKLLRRPIQEIHRGVWTSLLFKTVFC